MKAIDCPKCKGTGEIPLPDGLAATLKHVPWHYEICAERVHEKLGEHVGLTAINNRLARLLDLGFVNVRRDGKTLYFTRLAKLEGGK
jgi:hypothetical protein